MADFQQVLDTVVGVLPPDVRVQYQSFFTGLVNSAIRSISGSHLWRWRETYEDLTYDATNAVYSMPDDCIVVSQKGAALVDSSGDPAGAPLVYLPEREYYFRRPADDDSTNDDELYYIVLTKPSAEGRIQIRFWPNIAQTCRVWYYRKVSASEDVKFIENELMIIYYVWQSLPRSLFEDADKYMRMADSLLQAAISDDKKAVKEVLELVTNPRAAAHYKLMRSIQS